MNYMIYYLSINGIFIVKWHYVQQLVVYKVFPQNHGYKSNYSKDLADHKINSYARKAESIS